MQAALILGVGVFVFGATIHGDVVWLFVLAVFANLIFLNIGFAIAGAGEEPGRRRRDGERDRAADAVPVGHLLPDGYAARGAPGRRRVPAAHAVVEAMRIVAVDGEPISAAGPQLAMLAAWVLVSFAIARGLFRFQEV